MPLEIAVLLLPRFSLMALSAVLEPFRIANRLAGRDLYHWRFVSPEAGRVEASSGLPITAELSVRDPIAAQRVIVCTSFEPMAAAGRDVLRWLRRLDTQRCRALGRRHRRLPPGRGRPARRPHRHAALGIDRRLRRAVRQGRDPPLLVRALRPRRHLRRRHRRHRPGADRHRRRARQQPRPRRRRPADPPGHPRRRGTAAGGADAPLRDAESDGAGGDRPATALDRAAAVAWRRRQPRSPCRPASCSACSPPTSAARSSASTAKLRLERARELLEQTSLSVLSVAIATGFGSMEHFSRSYRATFGSSPRRGRPAPGMVTFPSSLHGAACCP